MSLVDDYRRQLAWRDWPSALDALPPLRAQRVLDLGCGVGDLTAALASRGARVVGVDGNRELLAAARARGTVGAEFVLGDLHRLPLSDGCVDGIWASFVAAYFCDLAGILASWRRQLRPGGWIALVEVDDLFAHEPLLPTTAALLRSYADAAAVAARYDFRMGGKLVEHLRRSGWRLERELRLRDDELAFAGPAAEGVVAAWAARLSRMRLLHDHCGDAFAAVRDDFLACLRRPDHRSIASVRMVVARAV